MKISKEAREVYIAFHDLKGRYANRVRCGCWDDVSGVQAMQSLINSTLDRAAEVARKEMWGEKQVLASQRDGDDGPSWYNEGCMDSAAAILALKEDTQ